MGIDTESQSRETESVVMYHIERDGKKITNTGFIEICEAAREAEALDAMFPGKFHDVFGVETAGV